MVAVVAADKPQMPVTSQARNRIEYLDGLRALAALYVVLTHMTGEAWSLENHHQPTGIFHILTGWLAYGHFAVSMFIVISGFCLMLPVVKNGDMVAGGFINFMKRRARRILPPYYLTVLISMLLAATLIRSKTGTIWDSSIPISIGGVYSHIILLQDLALPFQIDYPLWSISVEWRIYFLFPLLVLLWRRVGPLRAMLIVSVASYAMYVLLMRLGLELPNGFNTVVPQYIALFAVGMLGAMIAFCPDRRWQRLRVRVPWGLVAAGALAAFVSINVWWVLPDDGILDGVLGIGMLGILVGASHAGSNAIRAALSWKPLVFIGTMSYSLYLLHAPLMQIIWQYGLRPLRLSDDATYICLLLAGTPLIIAGTYIFHLFAQRPFMAATRKSIRSPAAS